MYLSKPNFDSASSSNPLLEVRWYVPRMAILLSLPKNELIAKHSNKKISSSKNYEKYACGQNRPNVAAMETQ